ncbi:hypothetical protein [Inquilinus sp. OTU3971]|uniref:hypothetical protein n=1 Tax=Inquilinus sp. OTU3971 TaxID=3043855 RepID=UPI00313E8E4E
MRIRIIERGFEAYTGPLGLIEFKDGLSVRDDLDLGEVNRLAAAMRIEREDGKQAGQGAALVEAHRSAVVESVAALPRDTKKDEQPPADPNASKAPAAPAEIYTREQLGELADKDGMKSLREVAAGYGVKSKSVAGLIDAIIDAQDRRRGVK